MQVMKSKTVKWLAILWFAVTMTLAAVAQENSSGGPPPEPNADSQSSAAPDASVTMDANGAPQASGGAEENGATESKAAPESDAARVSLIHGDVSMQRADTGEWTAATINTPLLRRAQLATREESRAEIQVDYANVLRLPSRRHADAPSRDDWDRWDRDRDGSIKEADSWRRTNRYDTGSNDLDSYGRWVNVPGYGDVWQPDQGADWAPYREGRWVWEPYWGWAWVSYEPWGWAPYHYGRWFYWNTGWAWWPGPIYPYYRPIC